MPAKRDAGVPADGAARAPGRPEVSPGTRDNRHRVNRWLGPDERTRTTRFGSRPRRASRDAGPSGRLELVPLRGAIHRGSC